MKILALDASAQSCSVALGEGEQIVKRSSRAHRQHAQNLLPLLESVLSECGVKAQEVDLLAFSCGPGSFTGLRVCAATVQGIAYAASIPVLPLSTLATMAQRVARVAKISAETQLLPLLDARIGQVYCGLYEVFGGSVRALAEDRLCTPAQAYALLREKRERCAVGSDWHTAVLNAGFSLPPHDLLDSYPDAQDVVCLAQNALRDGVRPLPAEQALPVYLRSADAWSRYAQTQEKK